jgi:hypothetical protein
MSDAEITAKGEASTGGQTPPSKPSPKPATETADVSRRPTTATLRRRTVSLLITLASVALSVVLGQAMWRAYVESPWTRDGTVRAYVVTMAPEISGRIVELRVTDNQFVHKGDLLMMMVVAWLATITLRRVVVRFGLLRYVWHPALFVFAVYMILLLSIVLLITE